MQADGHHTKKAWSEKKFEEKHPIRSLNVGRKKNLQKDTTNSAEIVKPRKNPSQGKSVAAMTKRTGTTKQESVHDYPSPKLSPK